MKSIYRSIDDSMHEQPEIGKYWGSEDFHYENGKPLPEPEYLENDPEAQATPTRIIPCSRPNSWEDGKEYEEGKDYEVRYKDPDRMDSNDASPVASPLSSNYEDELKQAIILLEKSFMKAPEPLATEIYEFIKRVTRITKKP